MENKKGAKNDNMIKPYNILTRQSETQTKSENNEKRKKNQNRSSMQLNKQTAARIAHTF